MNIANFNYAEAILWFLIAQVFFICALKIHRSSLNTNSNATGRRIRDYRNLCIYAAMAFIAFGSSDLIEARTGAWWRPWPLLVFKGLCIMALAAIYRQYRLIAIKK
jgi:hypothetical protein